MKKQQSHLAKRVIALSLMSVFSTPLFADEMGDLRAQLKAMQARLEQLEARQAEKAQAQPQTTAKNVVTEGATRGSFMLPGTNTSVTIGGAVKAVAIGSSISLGGTGNVGDETLIPATIPVGNAPQTNKWKLSGKESRLYVKTHTPSSLGDITTLLEGDFWGSGGNETATNSWGFRLRHAWATVGRFAAGQYWSNLVNFSATPETIDFNPQLGAFGATRQAGVRYTSPFTGGFWSVALENPETIIAGAAPQPDYDKAPDLNGKVHFKLGSGEYEVGALVRRLHSGAPGANGTPAGVAASSKSGAGLTVSGAIPVGAKNKFMFQVGSGKGIGRNWGGAPADAVWVGSSFEAIKATGGYVGYRHFWTPALRSNVDYSWLDMDNPANAAGTLDKAWRSAHLNLIWQAASNVEVGAEYLRATRELQNDRDGTLNRVLFMTRVAF